MADNWVLEARGLTKTFGKRKVVDRLSLKVGYGDIYGFLGPNGTGKTTTIRMMLGLIHPDEGEVLIDGFDLKKDFKRAIAAVGSIVENPSFFTYLSGRENLALMANLVPGLQRKKIDEVLNIVRLSDRADDKVKTYSLGMRQRLGIANALLGNPKLIVLDEPTNGLDPQGIEEIKALIGRLSSERGIAFFISSHLLYEVERICTRVGIVKEGRLLAEDSISRLLKREEDVREVVTEEAERALIVAQSAPFVKSAERISAGIRVSMQKGCTPKLTRLLVADQIGIDAIIPRNETLEQFFFEVQKKGAHHDQTA